MREVIYEPGMRGWGMKGGMGGWGMKGGCIKIVR